MVMLGSGWDHVLTKVKITQEIDYGEIFGVSSGVPGHRGKLVVGKLNGKAVCFMAGRFHLYEGYTAQEATTPIRVFAKLGVRRIVVTSASGGLNPKYKVGDLVILSDLLTTFLLDNPLKGAIFQDMSEVFEPKWREDAMKVCVDNKMPFHEGVYAYMHGPHYETFTDKMALRFLGADCVGMSTVPETIQAKALGLDVLGLSLVTNLAFVKHAHKDVVAAAKKASSKLAEVISKII